MGRKSTKNNKTIYQQTREENGFTREYVANHTYISVSTLEKIENESRYIHPEEVVELSKLYNQPKLCNYYCSNQCEIGKIYVPEIKTVHDLPRITLELLSSLNTISKYKDRLIDISSDGKITDDELDDFNKFKEYLDEMSLAIDSLKLWTND